MAGLAFGSFLRRRFVAWMLDFFVCGRCDVCVKAVCGRRGLPFWGGSGGGCCRRLGLLFVVGGSQLLSSVVLGGGWDGMFVFFFCGGPMAFLLTSLCRSLVSYDRKEEMRSVHRGGWDFGSVFWISFHLS